VARQPIAWTWANVSRAVGITVILSLLVAFLAAFVIDRPLDPVVTGAFLGVATLLVGGPSGLQAVLRNGSGEQPKPPSSG
jgi:hypothetical protein